MITVAQDKAPKPINLTAINSAANESHPHPASDSKTMFFSREQRKKWDIMIAQRLNTGKMWNAPKMLGGYVRTKDDDAGTFVTTEGRYPQYLYFSTKKDKEQGNYDVYVAQRLTRRAGFTTPTFINPISTQMDEAYPWLSSDGRNLFFSRNTKEGWRVFMTSRRQTTGLTGFGEPKLLEDIPVNFYHAALTPDAKTMYLQGPRKEGRQGLFVSKRNGSSWTKPQPLNVNHPDGTVGDVAPALTRNGKWLYFASDRPGGKGKLDVYIIQTAKLKVIEEKKASP